MKKKKILNICVLTLAALLVAACIYPFEADIDQTVSSLVVDGDILIGGTTEVTISYVQPLNADKYAFVTNAPYGKAWVEDDQGGIYNSGALETSSFSINTASAPADRNYRLHVEDYNTGRTYVSSWKSVNPAPVLDSLTYDFDENFLYIYLNAHSDEGAKYFRWTYTDVWKYHADYQTIYEYDPFSDSLNELILPDLTTYYCWARGSASEIELCTTAELSTDEVRRHKFISIPRTSYKIQEKYKLTVSLRNISEDAYSYLENLKLTSNLTGSLFSPNPSEMIGNVVCEQDSTITAVGYIDVAQVATGKLTVDHTNIYQYVTPTRYDLFTVEYGMRSRYSAGYRPITKDSDGNILWGRKECLDCRVDGGTLVKPSDWDD